MPKAFSEEEKEQIKNQILETAVELFHDKGTKSINIQELTRRAGIAQGSFYSFWKDKDALVMDVMLYRSRQKLDIAEKEFEASLHDPIGFLSKSIYRYSMDLLNKCREQPVYSQSFAILSRSNSLSENLFDAETAILVSPFIFLKHMLAYANINVNEYFQKYSLIGIYLFNRI